MMRVGWLVSIAVLIVTGPAAAAPDDRSCNQEPGNRFSWVERGFCDLALNGPEKAQGIIIWNHGIHQTTEQWRTPVPPVFRLLQVRGWDVITIKRHNLGETSTERSLYRAVERTLEQVRHEQQQGYGKIVLAGQSFGGYITLDAAEQSANVFAVIAMAPGVRLVGGGAGSRLDPSVTDRSLRRLKVERVALVLPKDDAIFGNVVRGPGAEKILRARALPYLLLDETSGLTGHGGGVTAKFALKYGICLNEFLSAQGLQAGRFACPAIDEWSVALEVLFPRHLESLSNAAPAGLEPLAGRWYTLLEDSLIVFALADAGGPQPRVIYRWSIPQIGGGLYHAMIAEGRVHVTLPSRARIVVEPAPGGPTLTWTSADGARVLRATLMKGGEAR
jgi:pimeloyl-ACP methyl ester carboxylesterase